MTTRAIIYCRFSPRPNADECTSNDRQAERCYAYCTQKGYVVGGTFKDSNVSGGTFYGRPELHLALAELKKGNVLVVDSVDRLTRDIAVTALIRQAVNQIGATIEYANGTPPSTTPEGELIENILGAFAQYERARIRLRTKIGLARKRKAGIVGGRCPIGYRRENGKLVPDEGEKDDVQSIARWYNLGHSVQEIVGLANDQIGTIRGRKWHERTVRRIIKREQDMSK